jgi:inosine-uridine nucleoside N-ribohydrolase
MDKKILIDTDPGIDDALALILALKSNLNIQAISTVAGNVELNQTQANAGYLLSKLDSNLKPIPGLAQPLTKSLTTTWIHGTTGLGKIDIKPKENLKSKIKKIIKTIEEKRIDTIITLGPLTNIAKIFQTSPKLEKQINEIIIMGGAIKSKGNITPHSEFNIYVDPEAAQIVFNSKIKKTLIPLKVCQQVILKEEFFNKINNKKLKDIINKIIKEYIKNNQKAGIDGAPMYDPLTVYYAINRQAYTTKQYKLDVVTNGKKRGKTKVSRSGPDIEVAIDIDEERFKKDFIDIINKG